MIEVEYHNIEKKETISEIELPDFIDYKPDLEQIEEKTSKYRDIDNLIIIGNGGSITSFRAIYYAFIEETDVNVEIVHTMEPSYLEKIRRKTRPENTLVMPISKSGSTTGVIESLLYFIDKNYSVFAVTSDKESPLKEIVEKENFEWIEHPDIGGRFTGAVETALTPASVLGLDIQEIRKGAENYYEKIKSENNPAKQTAELLYNAEKQGYNEVLTPFYTTKLFGFYPLQVQLMHESVCKQSEGQTYYGDIAPEYQHHTNQRLFGGKENCIPLFYTVENHVKKTINVPNELKQIKINENKLEDLENLKYGDSLQSEFEGVKQALENEEKPYLNIKIETIDHETVGALIAHFQFQAIYSAELRNVNPYNQPNVEKSKKLGYQQRFQKNGGKTI